MDTQYAQASQQKYRDSKTGDWTQGARQQNPESSDPILVQRSGGRRQAYPRHMAIWSSTALCNPTPPPPSPMVKAWQQILTCRDGGQDLRLVHGFVGRLQAPPHRSKLLQVPECGGLGFRGEGAASFVPRKLYQPWQVAAALRDIKSTLKFL